MKRFEGFSVVARWDYAQHSNGYGTKALYAGEQISQAEADRRFQDEVAKARAIVEKHAGHLDEGSKAALVSLTYNAGDKWTRSGLGEAVRNNDLEGAKALFLQYCKAGGETVPGLVRRRLEEISWFGSGAACPDGTQGTASTSRGAANVDGASGPSPSVMSADALRSGAMAGLGEVGQDALAAALRTQAGATNNATSNAAGADGNGRQWRDWRHLIESVLLAQYSVDPGAGVIGRPSNDIADDRDEPAALMPLLPKAG
jgi:GH24 family phage-related lysozyme (muramidase)